MAGASAGPSAGVPDEWGKRDDAELLALVRSQPLGSAERAAACEVLVKRYEHLASGFRRHAPGRSALDAKSAFELQCR